MTLKQKLVIRWSLVTGGLIAIFWAIWYLITGEVPVITSIKMTKDWTYVLPFGISRWWDIFIGPILSTLTILLLTNKKLKEDKGLGFSLVFGLVSGLGFSLVFGLVSGLGFSLVFGIVFSLGFGLVAGLVFSLALGLVVGLVLGIVFSLVFSLGFSLVFGIVFSLVFSLVFGIVFSLGFGLGFGLGTLIKLIANSKLWYKVWNWLMAKETAK